MVVYGVALLSACMLVGMFVGDLLGIAIGVKANVGGVGIAMLLLIFVTDHLRKDLRLDEWSQQGIGFWSAMWRP
jgi:malonate transporter MadL subunit